MSQQNKEYKFGPRLPSGGALGWDMTTLTDEQLEYEYLLAYESLYGHTYQGEVVLPGLLDPEYKTKSKVNFDEDTMKEALHVWKSRFKRAEDELERRYLLS